MKISIVYGQYTKAGYDDKYIFPTMIWKDNFYWKTDAKSVRCGISLSWWNFFVTFWATFD